MSGHQFSRGRRSLGLGHCRRVSPARAIVITAVISSLWYAPRAAAQYPPTCPAINKVVVCGGQPIFTDVYGQRETSIGMVTQGVQGCSARLVAIWIDSAGYVQPGKQQIGLSLAQLDDLHGGLFWYAPGSGTTECPYPGAPRRFFNDCYFAGCPWEAPHIPCSALPVPCEGYTIDDYNWYGAEPNVCAGGNGYLYAAADMEELLGESGEKALVFTRSADFGATFGPSGQWATSTATSTWMALTRAGIPAWE